MDIFHDPSAGSCSAATEPATSLSHTDPLPAERVPKEQARKTLMDRVLVTPMKKSSRLPLRFSSHSKPFTPSHSLRHHSQRAFSGHAFAPYPKRSLVSHNTENIPPKTPNKKLRRMLSDRSYFNGMASEASSSAKVRLFVNRRDSTSPKWLSKRTRRLSKPSPISSKSTSKSMSRTSSAAFGFTGDALHSSCPGLDSGLGVVETSAVDAISAKIHPTQDMDLELDFQTLRLEDDRGKGPSVNLDNSFWPKIYDTPQSEGSLPLADTLLSASASEPWHEGLHLLVARLQSALVAEVKARKLAEYQHLREMERRIEMEELVAQLRHEQEELLLVQRPLPSSSPLLLSSSPCASSKVVVNSALPGSQ